MDIQEKLNMIQYTSYKYNGKIWDSMETKEFFDYAFSKLLFDKAFEIINSQEDLLSYFDFQEIFKNFDNGISDIQNYLLKFMVIKGVKGVDSLLQNMPRELEEPFFYQLYLELHDKDNRPFWFSKITGCMKEEDKLSFVNNVIRDVSEDEILYLIKDLYENKNDSLLTELLRNEKVAEIAVDRINAPFFYEMVEELNLPRELIEKREQMLQQIITNYQEYESHDVKNAYCDFYFHDISENTLLDIRTIIDFANDDVVFRREYLGDIYNMLCNIEDYLSSDSKESNMGMSVLKANTVNYEILSKCYFMCQQRFKDLVSESIHRDVTSNIEPQILLSSSGMPVKFYNIENQTDLQRNVTMLVSTIPCSSEDAPEFRKIYYSGRNSEIKNGRRSCSLVNETKLTSLFGGDNRITFGYDDLNGRRITSATFGDGRTDGNEERFRRHRKVAKSNYHSVDKFIAGTQGHTEVTVNMGNTNEVMKPSYILITRDKPTPFEVDVACEFQIPIRGMNIKYYKQEPDIPYTTEDYNYYQFDRRKITSIQKDKTVV